MAASRGLPTGCSILTVASVVASWSSSTGTLGGRSGGDPGGGGSGAGLPDRSHVTSCTCQPLESLVNVSAGKRLCFRLREQ